MMQRHEQHSDAPDLGKVSFRPIWQGIKYASRSEAACSFLLQKYVPGWMPITGKTYQIALGFGRHVDFMVGSTLVEYHPIYLRWEFSRPAVYKAWELQLRDLPREKKETLRSIIRADKANFYYRERRAHIDHCPEAEIANAKLICVHSPGEFVARVLQPMTDRKLDAAAVTKEFLRLIRGKP